MNFEGQVGTQKCWTNSTYYKKHPVTANTFWAGSSNEEAAVHFIYGNLNYQQQAMMNSVTNGQIDDLAQSMPGVDYFDRALELFKNTRSGWFTLSHLQQRDFTVILTLQTNSYYFLHL